MEINMRGRQSIEEDLLRGLAVGQRWEGGANADGERQARVIIKMIEVVGRLDRWLLLRYLKQDGKVQESSGEEWAKWIENHAAVLTRTKGK